MERVLASALAILLLVAPPSSAEEPERPGPAGFEPTAQETLFLELVNRARADPAAEARRIREWAQSVRRPWVKRIDWDLFLLEMSEIPPAPPLVLDPHLVLAARNHAGYLLRLGDITHVEEEGRPGFTGVRYRDRAEAAGYGGFTSGENVGLARREPAYAHAMFVVDYGSTTAHGGMQPGRGHRRNVLGVVKAPRTDFGGALVGSERKAGIVQVFGIGKHPRSVGGAAYVDRNGNAFYDLGEGIGSAVVSVEGGAATTTWSSGAYRLSVEPDRAVRVTATWEGMRVSRRLPATPYGAWFSPAFPTPALRALVDEHLAAHEAARGAGDEDRALVLALDLNEKVGHRQLDDDRAERVRRVTVPAWERLERARAAVRQAMTLTDRKEARAAVRSAAAPFAATVAAFWFADAEAVLPLKLRAERLLARKADGHTPSRSSVASLVRKLRALRPDLQSTEWYEEVGRLVTALE